MKDFKRFVAIFTIILLILPAVSVLMGTEVQHEEKKYSSSAVSTAVSAQVSDTDTAKQTFKVLRTSTGAVEQVSAIDYICGVVAAEIPVSYHDEAIKAQAVAAFTYACYYRDKNLADPSSAASAISGADVSDDYRHYTAYISKQEAQSRWGNNFEADWNKIYKNVMAVRNKIMTYGGKPIDAEFFALSQGKTESCKNVWGNDLPYLVPVNSSWDKNAPDYKSSVVVKQEDVKTAVQGTYKDAKFDANPAKWIEIKKRSSSGTVLVAELCGQSVTGGDIRSLFGLRSADFTVSFSGGTFTFAVVGFGHNVGMSQYGAQYMAKQGKKWEEIVKHYYTGISISGYDWG